MEVYVTPPIPSRRGFCLTGPGEEVIVEEQTGPFRWDLVRKGFASPSGEFYWPAKASTVYRVLSGGQEAITAAHVQRVFTSDFTTEDDMWQTRGKTYSESSHAAKASDDCFAIEDGKMTLSVMEGEREGTFLTGHVGTGEVNDTARFAFTWGWAAAKVQVHPLWGATTGFWLQSQTGYAVGAGEVDIMEWGGKKNLTGKGGNFRSSVWYNDGTGNVVQSRQVVTPAVDLNLDPSVKPVIASVYWHPSFYDFWINGRRAGRVTQGLSTQPKFLVCSILVRDFQLDDIIENLGKISTYKAQFDWVRVWK